MNKDNKTEYLYMVVEVYEDEYDNTETLNVGIADTEKKAREFIKNRVPSLMYRVVGETPQVTKEVIDGKTFFLGDRGDTGYYRIIKIPKI